MSLALACFQALLAGMVAVQSPIQLYRVKGMFNLDTTVAFNLLAEINPSVFLNCTRKTELNSL